MTEGQTITRREFPNGDVAVDEGNGPGLPHAGRALHGGADPLAVAR